MRKALLPAFTAAAVFCTCFFCQRHTLMQQEFNGLFLLTGDYFREVFSGSLPLSNLLGSFLVQFYRISWAGPLATALLAAAAWLLARRIFRFTGKWSVVAASAAACTLWMLVAFSTTPAAPSAAFLIILALWAAVIAIDRRTGVNESGAVQNAAAAAMTAAAAAVIVFSPAIRDREVWDRIEHSAVHGKWADITAVITPYRASEDPNMLPFAALALAERGQLVSSFEKYPSRGPGDLDFEGLTDRRSYLFSSLFNASAGCTNEAIHQLFQSACNLPHGTSFGTIRQLIRYNMIAGNTAMASKYCSILARSPFNASTARDVAAAILAMDPEASPLDPGDSSEAAVITHSSAVNLKLLYDEGLFSPAAAEKARCLMMMGD